MYGATASSSSLCSSRLNKPSSVKGLCWDFGSLDYPSDCSSGSGADLPVAVSGTAMTPRTRIRSQSLLCDIVGISTLGWELNLIQPRKSTSPQLISSVMEHGQSSL